MRAWLVLTIAVPTAASALFRNAQPSTMELIAQSPRAESERPLQPTKRRRSAAFAGVAGLALGWRIVPSIIDPNAEFGTRVATAEAWRRRIKAKYHVPLLQRSPKILTSGLACFTLAEIMLAMQSDGLSPKQALLQTTLGVVSADLCLRVWNSPRLEPLTSRIILVRDKAQSLLPA